ncbi:right-handed parallel beta-helix repeat-containing protein [Skermanella sp. TT6]|uniref:Right-handed parallel beta-helix repeat-containing protein n=1 Tax=Skermanella cutis TaxID=2775420 RepID=A0ABX7BBI4_9PROT|nr:right-handed parallel beta-helix repeat-containing protein [Skermanella sp. TT6]QQP91504.1 right-handed parallel beta-helix repeat-containing protein [Skermanella sp. TT6]
MTPFSNITPQRTIWVSNKGSNSNSGSEGSPFKTIQAALDKATPGTAIMVKAGTYVENVNFKHSGTEKAPIWLISADGAGAAKIKPASAGTATIAGFGEENIVVRGFDVTAQSKQNGIQFGMAGTDFKDMVKNIVVEGNIIRGAGMDGIKISQGDNVHILGNTIIGAGDQGIDFVAVNDSVIARNDISKVTGVAGLFAKGGSTNVRIEYNRVHDVDVDGISIGGWTTPKWMRPGMRDYEAKNVVAIGNEVFDVGKRPLTFLGAVDSTATGNLLAGNPKYYTVVNVAAGKTGGKATPSSDITITNNTINRSNNWLNVESGQGKGLEVSNNRFDGVWNGKAGPGSGTVGAVPKPSDPVDTVTVTDPSYAMPSSVENANVTRPGGSKVTGNAKDNVIKGGAGNDVLDGAAGNDRLTGGGGNDVFVIAKGKGNDVITDFKAGAGAGDTVRLEGTPFGSFAAVKAAMKQAGADVVLDLGGGQTLKFLNIKIAAFAADDFGFSPVGSTPTPLPTLAQWRESAAFTDTIKGTAKNDTLTGTDRNEQMDGGSGHDVMAGGKGDDTYVAGSIYDKVVEKPGEGIDTVKLWDIAYTLPDNVENLIGLRAGGMTLTGNGLSNIIKGSAGNDTIIGGGGADQLYGGGGSDRFVFNGLGDKGDVIMDFKVGQDILDLRPLMSGHRADYDVEVVAKGAGAVAVWVHNDGKVDELVTLAGVGSDDIGSMQPGKAAWLLV